MNEFLKVLLNIRSLRAAIRELPFEQLQEAKEKFDLVYNERAESVEQERAEQEERQHAGHLIEHRLHLARVAHREVVFFDVPSDFKFLTRSTLATTAKETVKWEDGNEYPLVKIEISSASHPFYTGKHKVMDTSGRIDKFQRRYAR